MNSQMIIVKQKFTSVSFSFIRFVSDQLNLKFFYIWFSIAVQLTTNNILQ